MKLIRSFFLFTLALFLLISCESDLIHNNGDNLNDQRKLTIRLTDDPIDAEEVNIEILGVIIKTDEGLDSVSLETAAGIYNLLDYQNGVDTLIANTIIDFSNIKEIRLILGDQNSIKIGGELFPLIIPSGSQTGLKIKVNIDITNEELIEILIDFDALKSIIKTGNGTFHLKPVLKVKKIVKDGLPSESEEDEDENSTDSGNGENEGPCVRGKGYWKTHSNIGPASLDSAWLELSDGSQTEFFTTGETYISFLIRPSGNNPYVKLAQQYIIAELNGFAGAQLNEELLEAWNSAGELLANNSENQTLSEEDADTAKELTATLSKFNSGDLEVSSCDDQEDDNGDESEEDESEDGEDDDSEDSNCVRGKGYWKTHSEIGPASLDSAWLELTDGSQTEFFTTGDTYMSFLVRPSGNNPYVKLAQQYIIAELNGFAGAELTGDALDAWNKAAELLANFADTQKFSDDDADIAKGLASTIKSFNAGDLDAVSCDDDDEDDEDDEDDSDDDDDEDDEDDEDDSDDDDDEDDSDDDDDQNLTDAMVSTISDLFPGAEASEPKNSELCDGTAVLELKIEYNDRKIYLIFDSAGETFLSYYESSDDDDLPEAVKDKLKTDFDGYKIKSVNAWTSASEEHTFEVQIQKMSTKKTIIFSESGEILCD